MAGGIFTQHAFFSRLPLNNPERVLTWAGKHFCSLQLVGCFLGPNSLTEEWVCPFSQVPVFVFGFNGKPKGKPPFWELGSPKKDTQLYLEAHDCCVFIWGGTPSCFDFPLGVPCFPRNPSRKKKRRHTHTNPSKPDLKKPCLVAAHRQALARASAP